MSEHIRISAGQLAALEKIASAKGISAAEVLEIIIDEFFKRRQAAQIELEQQVDRRGEDTLGDCRHPNAKPTGRTCALGCCDWYECPDCRRTFLVEVPD
jgi:hypothetical protein